MFEQGFVLGLFFVSNPALSTGSPSEKTKVNKHMETTASLSDQVAVTPLSASLQAVAPN